jgi:hypothetical protein
MEKNILDKLKKVEDKRLKIQVITLSHKEDLSRKLNKKKEENYEKYLKSIETRQMYHEDKVIND